MAPGGPQEAPRGIPRLQMSAERFQQNRGFQFPLIFSGKIANSKARRDSRNVSASNEEKRKKGQMSAAVFAYKTRRKVLILIDFLACLRDIEGCMFEAGAPCRAPN